MCIRDRLFTGGASHISGISLLQAELFRVKIRVIPEAGHDLSVILQDRIGAVSYTHLDVYKRQR